MILIVTGSPGTGKTSISKELAEKMNCIHINISQLARQIGAVEKDYSRFDTYEIKDIEKILRHIKEKVLRHSCVIIDTHYPSIFQDEEIVGTVEKIIVLRTNPIVLKERLLRKKWPIAKVLENVEAELIGIVESDAIKLDSKKVFSIDTTNRTVEETVNLIIDCLRGECRGESIDWTLNNSVLEKLLEITR